ncbi:hypothetical protein FQR65_LT14642 [Abscondita terminalis]|nr:hypothetical protein FQR65_LT14642 [Abscondita terminalis]
MPMEKQQSATFYDNALKKAEDEHYDSEKIIAIFAECENKGMTNLIVVKKLSDELNALKNPLQDKQSHKGSKIKKKKQSNPLSPLGQLKDYEQKKEYEKASIFYTQNIKEGPDTIECANIMLKIYAKQKNHEKVQSLFKHLDNKKWLNSDSYRTMVPIILNSPAYYDSIASTLQQFKKSITNTGDLAEAIYFYHSYIEYLRSRNSMENTNEIDILVSELNELCLQLDNCADENSNDLTLCAAWLLNHYYPDKYKKQLLSKDSLRREEIWKFNKEVFEKLDRNVSLHATPEEDNQVHVINHKGELIKEIKKTNAIYDLLTDKRFGNYVIVEFLNAVKPSEIPLVISYQNKKYRTDIIGGPGRRHKHKNDRCKKLIAIPESALPWFLDCFSALPERAYYGQRCLIPENHYSGKQLVGRFQIGLVADGYAYGKYVVCDGFGLIKESLAKKLNIDLSIQSTKKSSSYLPFQALQTIPANKNQFFDLLQKKGKKATNDLTHFIEEVTQIIKNPSPESSKKNSSESSVLALPDEFFYLTSTGGIKTTLYTIIPTLGNDILLSPGEYKEGDGVIIGKSPYSTKSLNTAKVVLDEELSKKKVFQYTLAGFSQEGAFQAIYGQFEIVPDREWTSLHDCIFPQTDRKLKPNQKLIAKHQTKSQVIESVELHGVLCVTGKPAHPLMKVPIALAKADGNDFDGDIYDVMFAQNHSEFYVYLKNKPASLYANEKFERTHTQEGIGTLIDKFPDLQRDLLIPATEILNSICQLTEEECKKLAKHICFDETHHLNKLLPNVDLKVCNNYSNLLSLEIRQIIRHALSADKIQVNQSFYGRLQAYQTALYTCFPNKLSVSYGHGFQTKLNGVYSDLLKIGQKIKRQYETNHSVDNKSEWSQLVDKWISLLTQFQNLIQPITEAPPSPNIVGRNQQLSLAKLPTFFKEQISKIPETFKQLSQLESIGKEPQDELSLSSTMGLC